MCMCSMHVQVLHPQTVVAGMHPLQDLPLIGMVDPLLTPVALHRRAYLFFYSLARKLLSQHADMHRRLLPSALYDIGSRRDGASGMQSRGMWTVALLGFQLFVAVCCDESWASQQACRASAATPLLHVCCRPCVVLFTYCVCVPLASVKRRRSWAVLKVPLSGFTAGGLLQTARTGRTQRSRGTVCAICKCETLHLVHDAQQHATCHGHGGAACG
jgi:hypothetical protein